MAEAVYFLCVKNTSGNIKHKIKSNKLLPIERDGNAKIEFLFVIFNKQRKKSKITEKNVTKIKTTAVKYPSQQLKKLLNPCVYVLFLQAYIIAF